MALLQKLNYQKLNQIVLVLFIFTINSIKLIFLILK